MKHLVLIGLPGSGKSSLGRKAAQQLELPFLDMDQEIERQEGLSVTELFAQMGEAGFRDLEEAMAGKLAEGEPSVIATGGGVVLREATMRPLTERGLVVFLDRSPEAILEGVNLADRPLLAADPGRLHRLYEERIEAYRRYGTVSLRNEGTLWETVDRLVALYRKEGSK